MKSHSQGDLVLIVEQSTINFKALLRFVVAIVISSFPSYLPYL